MPSMNIDRGRPHHTTSKKATNLKHILFLLVCIMLSGFSIAQKKFNDSIAQSRNQTTRTAMITLGTWALANIASGFIIAGNTQGEARYAWRMNGYWNFINLGLAGMGYLNAIKAASRIYSFADNYEAQHAMEKIYVLNFGLDFAYIAGGLYLRERGNSASSIKSAGEYRGYGASIIIQGGFLLLMDGLMIRLHQKNTTRMNKKLRQFDLDAGPGGLGISYRF
jgi:uncharacterized membrane protein YidH (DUF202 family)